MDAGGLLEQEKFYCANCIATGAFNVEAYELDGGRPRIAADTKIDPENLTDVGQSFLVRVGESFYGGGEAIAHGSYGYFFKRSDGELKWAVMSLDLGPFIGVEPCENGVRFIASDGSRWEIIGDDVFGSHVEAGRSAC